MDIEEQETLPEPYQEDSAREIIKAMLKEAEMLGLPIKLPVSPELEIEFLSGGSHEVMKLLLKGKRVVTLTEDDLNGERYNEVIFTGSKDGKEVEVRYDKEGNRKDPVPNQQKEHHPEQPGIFKYPGDFPEKIGLRKVVKELKENFRMHTFPQPNILRKASKSTIPGGSTVVTKAA